MGNFGLSGLPIKVNNSQGSCVDDKLSSRINSTKEQENRSFSLTSPKDAIEEQHNCVEELCKILNDEDTDDETFKKLQETRISERLKESASHVKVQITALMETSKRDKILIKKLKDDIDTKNKYIETLKNKKEALSSETIQLYHSHKGNAVKDIETELIDLLKSHLNTIDLIKCNSLSEVDNSKMLIILSITESRLGTDAENAIKDVPCPGNTALLIFHIKESHALTNLASTDVLTDQSFKELGGIFDMAFKSEKGIYQCDMNDKALKSVCAFIKKGISKPREDI